ncbi:hypothetical protein HMPREF2896_00045 [Corynebacterium sp. HMSC069E04]|nr:hypothetical protein HMPREF2896_00045 [Corynebacterium sp. HMSC069E04]
MEVFDAGCAFRGKDFLSLQFFAKRLLAQFCEFEFVSQIKGVQMVTLVTCADMFMVTLMVTLNTPVVTLLDSRIFGGCRLSWAQPRSPEGRYRNCPLPVYFPCSGKLFLFQHSHDRAAAYPSFLGGFSG